MPNIKCGFTNCLTAHRCRMKITAQPLERECFFLETLGAAALRAGGGAEVTNKDTYVQTSGDGRWL